MKSVSSEPLLTTAKPKTASGSVAPAKTLPSQSSIARRIASRTTDLIAIGVVLAAALSFGREIVVWWRAEPPTVTIDAAAEAPAALWETPGAAVTLDFGDRPLSLARQSVSGEHDRALEALLGACC